jgi:hypothetical protein
MKYDKRGTKIRMEDIRTIHLQKIKRSLEEKKLSRQVPPLCHDLTISICIILHVRVVPRVGPIK